MSLDRKKGTKKITFSNFPIRAVTRSLKEEKLNNKLYI
jgi:hypothetical protein